jgi:uncharacterized membrane protein YhiD involved in acid resistance
VRHVLLALSAAAVLGAALGIVRPIRREIVPRSIHVVHAQVLLAIVGALIMIVVAESLARAFAIVGAAGLIRYRSRIEDPKDAGVMLIALSLGLAVGSGLFVVAGVSCVFVMGVLWLLESFEPPARWRFDLTIATKDAAKLQPDIEKALSHRDLTYELRGSSMNELHYEVTVPFEQEIRKLTKLIRSLDRGHGTSIEWEIKKYKTVEQ